MAAPRLLPPTSELVRLVEDGLTHAQIAEHVERTTGVRVSRTAISVALHRAGLSKDAMRYRAELPWKVRGEHLTQYPARMLRLLGRRRAGIQLTTEEGERLDAWLEGLAEKDLVVGYAPDYEGFLYVYADEKYDRPNGVPIRSRTIDNEEIEELE